MMKKKEKKMMMMMKKKTSKAFIRKDFNVKVIRNVSGYVVY